MFKNHIRNLLNKKHLNIPNENLMISLPKLTLYLTYSVIVSNGDGRRHTPRTHIYIDLC